ncbi:YeeE/YedE family protein [Alsobacter sp. SYSU M60028]|uniref:YeeE/YedE family protein n=1 Tax=Alsobacter ponti TaxID=2962936 RepID=A0ABT1LGI7_9HYPH|nr:YeeE/YedE family protein [Alsobacter ponti]MCP8940619.1 YeeE/YedE family protein [Alsobacter ponti]
MAAVISLLAGLVFGAGLAISGMIDPARVLGFFDVAGAWDPTLAFVMAGALAVTIPGYRLAFARRAPVAGRTFHVPTASAIDRPLLGGAALFGVGWGLAGFCPGPAIAALATLAPKVWLFVAAMLVGMAAAKVWRDRAGADPAPAPLPSGQGR